MAVRKDAGTGMYVSDRVGGYFNTTEDARAAEDSSMDTLEFGSGGIQGPAPDAPAPAADPRDAPNPSNPGGISDNEVARRRAAISNSGTANANINVNTNPYNRAVTPEQAAAAKPAGVTGAYESGSDASRAAFDYTHDLANPGVFSTPSQFLNRAGESVGVSHAGDSIDFTPGLSLTPEDLMRSTTTRSTRLGTTADGLGGRSVPAAASAYSAGGRAPIPTPGNGAFGGAVGPSGTREDAAAKRADDAGARFGAENASNEAENSQAWGKAWDAIDNIRGGDYALSDEARGFQKEGLQQQRDLLKRTLGFDPNQYATQFADQGLARSVALARSGGSAAQQQAQTFAALEGAPALYAEGARQAAGLENQRLATAEQAAQAFGQLGTMTRSSDEQRAQFESDLTKEISKQTSALTQGQVQLNEEESKMFAQMWTDFAQLQSVYAGMDSDEMLAWWQKEATERGQDKQFQAVMEGLKQNGAISSKDLIGGLFQLGGGVIGAGGSIGAAYAGRH